MHKWPPRRSLQHDGGVERQRPPAQMQQRASKLYALGAVGFIHLLRDLLDPVRDPREAGREHVEQGRNAR